MSQPTEQADVAERQGTTLVRMAWTGTVLFVVTAVLGVVDPDAFELLVVAVSLVLFLVGCLAFLWAYAVAVSRSREDLISISGLFFLQGSAPAGVRRNLLGALAVEVVVAFAAASIRPFTGVAFAILVPVFGLGLAGLWGARYGTFPPRPAPESQ